MAKQPFSGAIQVQGAAELRYALLKAEGNLKDLEAIHKDAADKVRGEAKARVPVVTGNLGASIQSGASGYSGYVWAGGTADVPYAGPIHFGWPEHHIEAQPFLYDALDDRREQIIKLYRRRVDAVIERIDAETPG